VPFTLSTAPNTTPNTTTTTEAGTTGTMTTTVVIPTGPGSETTSSTTSPTCIYRIRCGKESDFDDLLGRRWFADAFYSSSTKARAVAKTVVDLTAFYGVPYNPLVNKHTAFHHSPHPLNLDSALFHYERVSSFHPDHPPTIPFYSFPLPSGKYSINMFFAETSVLPVGSRTFGVDINGQVMIPEIDIISEAGVNTALGHSIAGIDVHNGHLNLSFIRRVGNPKISGIEICPSHVPAPPAQIPTPVTNVRIRAGHFAPLTDEKSNVWYGDAFFEPENSKTRSVPTVALDAPAALWPLFYYERYSSAQQTSPVMYSVPVKPGIFSLTLLFAETSFVAVGARVFDVVVNNETRIYALDIAREVGIGKVLARNIPNIVALGGLLQIGFVRHSGNPKVSGLEIERTGDAPTQPANQSHFALHMRCGNSMAALVDGHGTTWMPDANFLVGNTKARPVKKMPIANASVETWPLYYYERYSASPVADATFYEIPVPRGTFTVTLHFCETSAISVGTRVFDIIINDHRYAKEVDIVAAVGVGAVLKLEFPFVGVSTGLLRIDLARITGNPKINALEIVASSGDVLASPDPLTSLHLNAGSRTAVTVGAQTWIADTDYMVDGTQARAVAHVSLTGQSRDWWPLFYTERYLASPSADDLFYRLPFVDGTYCVTLYFSEIYFNPATPRVFDIVINGMTMVHSLDVYKEVGLFSTLQRTVADVSPVDGLIYVGLRAVTGKPKINALQVVPCSSAQV